MPTPQQIEDKLTPAAKEAVEEIIKDFRTQLLLRAGESASRLGDLREVSVHDIVGAIGRQPTPFFRGKVSRWIFMLRVFALTGTMVGLVAIMVFMTAHFSEWVAIIESRPTLLAGIAGLVIGAASWFFLAEWMRPRLLSKDIDEVRSPDYMGAYLMKWVQLETALRNVASATLGESNAALPIPRLIENLAAADVIAPEDHEQLLNLLSLRNALAHGKQSDTQKTKIVEAVRKADLLLAQLERFMG